MDRIEKTLIAATLLLIPTYLIKFTIFGIPTNVLEIFVLLTFISYLAKGQCRFFEFYNDNKIYAWAILAIFAGLLISTLANENYRTGFGIIKGWLVMPMAFAWIVYAESKTAEDFKSIIKWLYWGIFSVAVIALGYYFSR